MTQRRSFLYRKPSGSAMMMCSPKESMSPGGEDMGLGSRIPRLRRTGSLRGPRDKYPGLWETIPEKKEPSAFAADPRKCPLASPATGRRMQTVTDRTRSLSYSGISPLPMRRPHHLPLGLSSGGCSYPHTPTPSPEAADDCDSVQSFGSNYSSASCDCVFAKNGTTFSGRKMKYVVHCAKRPDNAEEYLTPTQRAQRQIRNLKLLLLEARKDIERKDAEIFKLTKELVELRLYKPEANEDEGEKKEPEEHSTPKEGKQKLSASNQSELHQITPDFDSHHSLDIPPSLADSGNYEDFSASPTVDFPKDSMQFHSVDVGLGTDMVDEEIEAGRLMANYERQMEEIKRNHTTEYQELKEKYNDKVEVLLQKLSDMNSRYCELRPKYDQAQERIWELEKELEAAHKQLEEEINKNQKMYLKMYMKGQEAAKFEHADQVLEFAHQAPTRVSVPELLQQLKVAESELDKMKGKKAPPSEKSQSALALLNAGEAISLWMTGLRKALYRRVMERSVNKSEIDPEVTLQFLKSAIYYFLTDRENHKGHLTAIESILGYNEFEKLNIEKAYKAAYKR